MRVRECDLKHMEHLWKGIYLSSLLDSTTTVNYLLMLKRNCQYWIKYKKKKSCIKNAKISEICIDIRILRTSNANINQCLQYSFAIVMDQNEQ